MPQSSKPRQTYYALVALTFDSRTDEAAFMAALGGLPSIEVTFTHDAPDHSRPGLVAGLAYTARGANKTDVTSKLKRAASVSGVEPQILRGAVGLSVPATSTTDLGLAPTAPSRAAPALPAGPTRPAWCSSRVSFEQLVAQALLWAEEHPGALPHLFRADGVMGLVSHGHQPSTPSPPTPDERTALVDQMVTAAARSLDGSDAGALVFLTHHDGARFTVVHAFSREERRTLMAPVSDGVPADMTTTGPWTEVPDNGRFGALYAP